MSHDSPSARNAFVKAQRTGGGSGGSIWRLFLFGCLAVSLGTAFAAEDAAQRWAFEPLKAVQLPVPATSADKNWIRNQVDAFILAGLEQRHLKPAPPASRWTLLRRATFDLIGLPPSPEEMAAFLKNTRPDAYANLVERLLVSSHYGERWARHWLDLVRYADSGGFEKDLSYTNAWRFRDYVIRSFNANKPVNRFIEEQVAGDELWPEDPEATLATSLYAIGPVSQDSALNSTQLEYEWLTDTADTTGAAFLGLTMGCARCHNHKYDPISQQDYFAMQAIFAASDRPYPDAVREHRIKGLNGILADVPIPKELLQDPRCTIQTDALAGSRLFHRDGPMEIHRLKRGELSKPMELVAPALPAIFAVDQLLFDPAAATPGQRRAVLAKWLVSPGNPLTARVLVNRVWAWHFGQGIVRTPSDFGAQGERPTHRELLDWLAQDFMQHHWDLNYLHRLIMSSATYQMQSSLDAPDALKTDPEDRLMWHFPRRRLDSEAIWDSVHAAAGTLNLKPFGQPVLPPLSKEELSGLFDEKSWTVTKDPAEFSRRGIYLLERRTFLFPMFDAFDPPDVMTSCSRRFETTVPTQALALLNGAVAEDQARAFARRLNAECAGKLDKIPARAWLLAFNRPITRPEKERVLEFFRQRKAALLQRAKTGLPPSPEGTNADAAALLSTTNGQSSAEEPWLQTALTEFCLALFNANEFVFID